MFYSWCCRHWRSLSFLRNCLWYAKKMLWPFPLVLTGWSSQRNQRLLRVRQPYSSLWGWSYCFMVGSVFRSIWLLLIKFQAFPHRHPFHCVHRLPELVIHVFCFQVDRSTASKILQGDSETRQRVTTNCCLFVLILPPIVEFFDREENSVRRGYSYVYLFKILTFISRLVFWPRDWVTTHRR